MGSSGLGLKRKEVSRDRVTVQGLERTCGRLFLDSGAHSLYNLHAQKKRGPSKFAWFAKEGKLTKRFRKEIDKYAAFVKANQDGIDRYATMDVIFNPKLSWQSLKYLENEHGLKPMPVIHYGTTMDWVEKHLDAGYKYLGIGGIGQEATRYSYVGWADELFDFLCPHPKRLPLVKTHGFAMTSVPLVTRYPWFSVDSSRWAKAAGYGSILVPHRRAGKFTFEVDPYLIAFSHRSEARAQMMQHIDSVGPECRRTVCAWLKEIEIPFGAVDKKGNTVEYGVYSQYHARAVANLRFFERLAASMPAWPWPFNVHVHKGLFN
jgi:hypothetical protein